LVVTEPAITVIHDAREDQYLIRFRYAWEGREEHVVSVTLGPAGIEDLSAKLEVAVRAHARPSTPPEKELRWYKISSRAGHRIVYAQGTSEQEAHAVSSLNKLHPGEVFISMMARDFKP